MKATSSFYTKSLITSCAVFASAAVSFGQSDEDDKEVFELSPFVVDGANDSGYRATNTLAGSRINTELKDVAAAITVITEEFLDDISAVDINDVLVYTGNTESTGNYTATSGDLGRSADDASNDSSNANRVRGLTSATITRNYFVTQGVGFDAYNTERITINRGPNSSLFGLGSAGGIVNYTTKKASLGKDFNEVSFRYGSYDDTRATFDVNRVIADDVFALRIAGLYSDRGFRQQPSYDYDRRIFLAAHYKPFKGADVRAEYEQANRNQNNPNYLTMGDLVTPWIDEGKPTWDPLTENPDNMWEKGSLWAGGGTAGYVNGATGETEYFLGNAWTGAGAKANVWQPNTTDAALFTEIGLSNNDYVDNHHINFNPNTSDSEADTMSVSWDQKVSENFYLNVAYFREDVDSTSRSYNRGSSFSLMVDPNLTLLNGAADPTNPNFGKLFISQRAEDTLGLWSSKNDSLRATATYQLDLREVSEWIGKFTFTALYEDRQNDTIFEGFNENRSDIPDYLDASNRVTTDDFRFDRFQYIGEIGNVVAPVAPLSQNSGVSHTYWDWDSGSFKSDSMNTDFLGKRRDLVNTGVESTAIVMQGKVLKDRLSLLVGYRDDEQVEMRSSSVGIDPATGLLAIDDTFDEPGVGGDSTLTKGAVFQATDWLSLHYNESENFIPRGAAVNILGERIGSPTGEGKDMGLSVQLLEDKLFAKFNWYEVTAANGDADGDTSIVARWELAYIDQVVIPSIADMYGITDYVTGAPEGSAPWGSSSIFASADTVSEGFEFEMTYNPTSNWRIMANVSQQEVKASNVGGGINRFLEERLPYWQGLAGGQVWSGDLLYDNWGSPGNGEDWYNRFPLDAVLKFRSAEGKPNPQVREWRANFVTNYDISEGKFAGVNFGGALRWQDESVIGHPVITDTVNGSVVPVGLDLANPYTTSAETDIDLWVGYGKKIMDEKVDMYVSFNIKNATDSEGFTPIVANSDGQGAVFRIEQPRTFYLTTTFNW